jgi:hypothetical protein
MEDNLINPLNYTLAAKKELEENNYKGPFLGIQDAGFKDPNELISTTDLYGTVYESGVFFEMRYADPIIGSIMEFRKNSVSALEYNVVPRDKAPTERQSIAADSVKWLINRIPNQSLNGFISHAYDQIFSFGFAFTKCMFPKKDQIRALCAFTTFQHSRLNGLTLTKQEHALNQFVYRLETIL